MPLGNWRHGRSRKRMMMGFKSQAELNRLSYEERMRFLHTHLPLGYDPESHDQFWLPEADRYAGMYVIGKTGTGKSSFLEGLSCHDAAIGNAMFFVDPHDDVTNNVMASLPPQCLPQVAVIDMRDFESPFGLNLFDGAADIKTPIDLQLAISRIEHIFRVVWPDVMSQQNLPRYLKAAVITLLANPGSTLVDMYRLLLDDDFRHKLQKNVRNQGVQTFWQTQFDELSPAERRRVVQPLIGRLESLFMGRDLVSNIVGQRETSINFRRAIENRELVFIKLPSSLGSDATLIGTIILAQLSAAVFSFADVPERERPGVTIIVDEFQNFATPDFAKLFTEGRKFGARVIVAHQYRSQLDDDLQKATMGVRTHVCFCINPDDANKMGQLFDAPEGELELSTRATKELLSRSADFPLVVQEFVETYLRHIPKGGGEDD